MEEETKVAVAILEKTCYDLGMDKNMNKLIPSQTTKRLWNKVSLQVNLPAAWQIFDKIARGQAISRVDSHTLIDLFQSLGISANSKIYPGRNEGVRWDAAIQSYTNDHQLDELDDAIIKAFEYFTQQITAQDIIIAKFPTCPTTAPDLQKFYGIMYLKVLNCWRDVLRKIRKEPLQRRIDMIMAMFSNDDVGLARKTEIAQRAGIEIAGGSSSEMYSAVRAASEAKSAEEVADQVFVELDVESEEVVRLYSEHRKKVEQALAKVTYVLTNPGNEGIANFIG